MKTPIEHLQSRIDEMKATIQHIAIQRTGDSIERVLFDINKNLEIQKIESEIRGYKKAIKILQQDSEFTINED